MLAINPRRRAIKLTPHTHTQANQNLHFQLEPSAKDFHRVRSMESSTATPSFPSISTLSPACCRTAVAELKRNLPHRKKERAEDDEIAGYKELLTNPETKTLSRFEGLSSNSEPVDVKKEGTLRTLSLAAPNTILVKSRLLPKIRVYPLTNLKPHPLACTLTLSLSQFKVRSERPTTTLTEANFPFAALIQHATVEINEDEADCAVSEFCDEYANEPSRAVQERVDIASKVLMQLDSWQRVCFGAFSPPDLRDITTKPDIVILDPGT
ncbi:hypothetical protein COLO4_16304 [Corchorus olitorius]|uniref:Uncharacterized protein n=1 Tax=Corchorus olitorius TaxID=93759 RepID=A0A1R3JIC4_9ROSI|nr:hypothetical protein COLO4_16304 [Corchorus olitorius]